LDGFDRLGGTQAHVTAFFLTPGGAFGFMGQPAMPHLSWNEVRDRAIRFSREHAGDHSEKFE
jgi:hypothetical protein